MFIYPRGYLSVSQMTMVEHKGGHNWSVTGHVGIFMQSVQLIQCKLQIKALWVQISTVLNCLLQVLSKVSNAFCTCRFFLTRGY